MLPPHVQDTVRGQIISIPDMPHNNLSSLMVLDAIRTYAYNGKRIEITYTQFETEKGSSNDQSS